MRLVWPGLGGEPLRDLTLSGYIEQHWKFHHFDEVRGTFFAGSPEGMHKLFADYNSTVHEILKAGHIDCEQGILAIIGSSRPSYIRWVPSNFHGVMHVC